MASPACVTRTRASQDPGCSPQTPLSMVAPNSGANLDVRQGAPRPGVSVPCRTGLIGSGSLGGGDPWDLALHRVHRRQGCSPGSTGSAPCVGLLMAAWDHLYGGGVGVGV